MTASQLRVVETPAAFVFLDGRESPVWPRPARDGAAHTFVWAEVQRLPTVVRRAIADCPITCDDRTDDEVQRDFPQPDPASIALGVYVAHGRARRILLFVDVIARRASNGDWRGDLRRTLRHEIAHALGADHAAIHALGDLNG